MVTVVTQMRAVTLYEANDGSRWNTTQDALRRDLMTVRVETIMMTLPKIPTNSDERIAVPKSDVLRAKTAVVAICRQEHPGESAFHHAPADIHSFGYAGRFLSEASGPAAKPLNSAWTWFMCYDASTGFLYNQPFFANNPDQWTGVTR